LSKGTLNVADITILIPAIFLMGSQLQYMGRLLGVIASPGRPNSPISGAHSWPINCITPSKLSISAIPVTRLIFLLSAHAKDLISPSTT
jgi:hypothetical protein